MHWPNGKLAGRTPRYQALGNAMTVDVLDRIAGRLENHVLDRKVERAERDIVVMLRDDALRRRKEEGR